MESSKHNDGKKDPKQPNQKQQNLSVPTSDKSKYFGKFADPAYFKRLPILTRKDLVKVNEFKTLLLRLGANPLYTGDVFIYIGHFEDKPFFAHIENLNIVVTRTIDFKEGLQELLDANLVEEIKKIGWIVLMGGKWGFLMDLNCLHEIYQGLMPEFWKKVLKYSFFQNQFRKFAFYYQQELNLNISEIPSTEIDSPVPATICPLAPQLFIHQKQEVGWMFQLEKDPRLAIAGEFKAIPFLDSGYYLDPQDPTRLVVEVVKTKVRMPGGILASQVGSGKTVSVIGLITIGKDEDANKILNVQKGKEDNSQNEIQEIVQTKHKIYIDDQEEDEEGKLNGEAIENKPEVTWEIEGHGPTLVVVTRNILYQWYEEFQRFAPQLRVFCLEKWEQLKDLQVEEVEKGIFKFKDYDVLLTHRRIIEEGCDEFPTRLPKIFDMVFKRVIFDEFHELITQYFIQKSQMAAMEEAMASKKDKSAKNKKVVPHEEISTICEVINMLKFEACINSFKRQFTWGVTGTPDSLEFQKHTEILFSLLSLNNQYSEIHIYQAFRNSFVKRFMRSNPCKLNLKKLAKDVDYVTLYQLQNLLYKGKLTYAINEKEAQLLCSHLLPQYKNLEHEPDNIDLAIQAIENKHKEEIKKVQHKLEEFRDELGGDLEKVFMEIKEEVKRKGLEKFVADEKDAYEDDDNEGNELGEMVLADETISPRRRGKKGKGRGKLDQEGLEESKSAKATPNKKKHSKKGALKNDFEGEEVDQEGEDYQYEEDDFEGKRYVEIDGKLIEEETKESKDTPKKAKKQKKKKQEQQRFIMEEKLGGEITEVKETDTELHEEEKFEKMIDGSKKMNTKTQILVNRLVSLEEENNFYMEMSKLLTGKIFECPICLTEVHNQMLVVTDCLHQICVDCYKVLIKSAQHPRCPLCKDSLEDNKLIIHPRYRTEKRNKLTAIVDAIKKTPRDDKIIVYTQFHSLVDKLEELFTQMGMKYMVLRGEPSEINIALMKFKTLDLKVLLMSVEQSASGINVTEANHVFFAHPIFGMTFEKAALTYNQCIGRAYRIGQTKDVHVTLFVTKNSLESELVPSFYKY